MSIFSTEFHTKIVVFLALLNMGVVIFFFHKFNYSLLKMIDTFQAILELAEKGKKATKDATNIHNAN